MATIRRRTVLKRACALLCLVCLSISVPAAIAPKGAGEAVQTNYDILERIAEEVVVEIIANMPELGRLKLVRLVKTKSAGDVDFLFENTLVKTMRSAGFRITLERPAEGVADSASADYRFSYQLIRMSLSYPKISRRYWLGGKQVERRAEIGLFAQLVDLRSGDIIWIGDTEKKYEDVIGYGMLEYVEDAKIGFTKPERKEVRWSRLIEPVVVTGIVTGLVYLFFSNQKNEE